MQFLYPSFLWALTALAIPVIVHLFNFRRYKTVEFSSIRFLKEVTQETTSQNRVRHWIVLFLRLLALFCLVMAFAHPFLTGKQIGKTNNTHTVSVFIDNSFSMNATNNGVPLIETAKQKAKEIAQAYALDDRFQLITNEMAGKDQRLLSKDDFIKAVDEIHSSPASGYFSLIMKKQAAALSTIKEGAHDAYLISDFQPAQNDVDRMPIDTAITFHAVQLKSDDLANLAIDSVWFDSPLQTVNNTSKLIVRIINYGATNVTSNRLTFKLNDQLKSVGDFNLEKESTRLDTIPLTITKSGWNTGEVSINDNPIVFDDHYFFSFHVEEQLKVTIINQQKESVYLTNLFKQDPQFELTNMPVQQINYNTLKEQHCIILNEVLQISSGLADQLTTFVKSGGTLLIVPGVNMDATALNNCLTAMHANTLIAMSEANQAVTFINTAENTFKNVFSKLNENMDLPYVKRLFVFSKSTNVNEEVLLACKNKLSLVSKYNVEKGKLFVLAVPLSTDASDLPVKAVFVPLMLNIALSGIHNSAASFIIGQNAPITVPNDTKSTETAYKLKGKSEEFIPEQRAIGATLLLKVNDHLHTAGFYELKTGAVENNPLIAFNYNRLESNQHFDDPATLKEKLAARNFLLTNGTQTNLTGLVNEINQGITLWRWFIILALLALLAEVLVLHFWKP